MPQTVFFLFYAKKNVVFLLNVTQRENKALRSIQAYYKACVVGELLASVTYD